MWAFFCLKSVPKTIPCNILNFKWNYVVHLCLRANLGRQRDFSLCWVRFQMFPSSLGLRHAKSATQSDTEAIPVTVLKRYSHGSTLPPKGLPQIFVCAVMSTQAVCTWPTLHKNQQDEPAIMNRDNCNIFLDFLLPYHICTCPKHCKAISRTMNKDTYVNVPQCALAHIEFCLRLILYCCLAGSMLPNPHEGRIWKNATAWC